MATLDILKKARLEKLDGIRLLGVDPYPARVERVERIIEARSKTDKKVVITGRIIGTRKQGKISFTDLFDGSGKIQVVLKSDLLDKLSQELLAFLDIGDFISVSGKVGKTSSGEISVFAENFQIISKSIRPLPDKWYGLEDIEDRYRKRYLDLLLNPDVRNKLETRSKVVKFIRNFLDDKGFLEIETPTLQPVYGGGCRKP